MAETNPTQTANPISSFLSQLKTNVDIFVGVAAVGVVLMLIIPLPPLILDILLIANLSMSFMIILSTVYIKNPADFNAFPTLILLTTVFGLALNVSSTRLILIDGFAGNIIQAFGSFVVRQNLVVGLIIFIILLAIQFLVITKGAGRVSEVAARFTLDALPGKQLAINEDLNAGLIDEEEAKKRRQDLRMEADFYGAMDGSSKFVSGNIKVALVVTLVDIIGGLIVGMAQRGLGLDEAASTYILLTVGDGLVSQIPALLISTATGIIVTRTTSREKFAKDVVKQIGSAPQVLYIAGAGIAVMGVLPGFPTLLNFLFGGALAGIGYLMQRSVKKKEAEQQETARGVQQQEKTTTIEDIVRLDPMSLEIGYNLIPLVDKEQGGDLLERIKLIRKRIGLELGILVPPIRIIDNVTIDSSDYLIKIRGTEIARGKVLVNRLLAMNPSLDLEGIDGLEVREPAFNMKAKWISEEQRSKAESMGFDIFDPPNVVATHLTEVIKNNAAELLSRQDVQSMIDALRREYPAVIEEVLKNANVGEIQKVLQNLLKEGVKVRNMLAILETIADYAASVKNIDLLTEYVRQTLGKQIVSRFADESKNLKGIVIDPELEEILSASIQDTPQGLVSTLDTEILHQFVNHAGARIEEALKKGYQPVVLSSQKTRRLVREMLQRSFPGIGVLSYSEIPSDYSLDQVGIVQMDLELAGI